METNNNSAEFLKSLLIDFFIGNMKNAIIGNEVMYGIQRKVVDLLVLNQEKIYAIEIKGEKDNLKRLSAQIEEYSKVFDYVIICADSSHYEKISSSVSEDIGIYLVENNIISIKRKPKQQKGQIKSEMLYTINSKYLKQQDKSLKRLNSDEVRTFYEKKSKKDIHNLLSSFFVSKIEEKFQLFLSDKGLNTNIDDIPTLSSQTNIE